MHFEFSTASRIIFGSGCLEQIGTLGRDWGRRVLIVTGRDPERASALREHLDEAGVTSVVYSVAGEPTLQTIEEGSEVVRAEACDWVIGFGGGSAMDAGKAIAIMHTQEGEILDYLEVIGKGRPIRREGLPYIAVPTTSGTGAEVTRNAVLGFPEHGIKVSLRSPLMLPRVALVDPSLTLGLPFEITASTGLDALTQLIEAAVSSRANPMTDALCEKGIQLAAASLERCCFQPGEIGPREDMALAALYSGIALANAGLGAVHGFAAPIGGMFSAPHGAVCAALLPHVWRANLKAIQPQQKGKFDRVAQGLLSDASARAEQVQDWIEGLCLRLRIRPLAALGVSASDVTEIARRAAQASSMKANPVNHGPAALEAILMEAIRVS
jgi:alcohol dehydrogenase class IV